MNNFTTDLQTKYVETQLRITEQFEKLSRKLGMRKELDAALNEKRIIRAITENDTETAKKEVANHTPEKDRMFSTKDTIATNCFKMAIENKNIDICNSMIEADYPHSMSLSDRQNIAIMMIEADMIDTFLSFEEKGNVLNDSAKYGFISDVARTIAETENKELLTTIMKKSAIHASVKDGVLAHATAAEKKDNIQTCLEHGAKYSEFYLYKHLINNNQKEMALFVTEQVLKDGDQKTPAAAIQYAEEVGRDALALSLREVVHAGTNPTEAWSKLADDTAVLKQYDSLTDTTLTQIFNTTDKTVITAVNAKTPDEDMPAMIKESHADLKEGEKKKYQQAVNFLAQKKQP